MLTYYFILFFRSSLSNLFLVDGTSLHFKSKVIHQPGFYIIHVDEMKNLPFLISSQNFITPKYVRVLINSSENIHLLKTTTRKIYLFEDTHNYSVYIGNSTKPQRINSRELSNQTLIRSFSKTSKLHFFNRWSSGTLQEIPSIIQYDGTYLHPNHPIHSKGLKGQNEIIALIDTGIDMNHCLFRDDNNPPPFNQTNFNHRKVIRYEALGDSSDVTAGHGTHVAGTLAGKANCLNCSAAMYNGQAPEAKLLFYDLAKGNSVITEPDFELILPQFEEFGISVSSNSWGFDSDDMVYSNYFDSIAYQYPFITFVFAVGNPAKPLTISVPSSSKNVIGVSSTSNSESSKLDKGFTDIFSIETNHHSFPCKVANNSKSLLKQITDHPNFSFQDLSTDQYFLFTESLPVNYDKYRLIISNHNFQCPETQFCLYVEKKSCIFCYSEILQNFSFCIIYF